MIRGFLVLSFLGAASVGYAQEKTESAPRYDEAREAEIAKRAKKRIYPGGRDEEELKVQPQVTHPPRKLAPQADVREEASEE